MVELACIKSKQKKKFYSENHSKVFSAVLRFEEIYFDELSELLDINEKELKEILDYLIERKLISKKNFQYCSFEPFESANSLTVLSSCPKKSSGLLI